MSKPKPVKLTTLTEQEAKDLYGDVEPQPMAAVGFEGGGGGGPVEWDDVQNKPELADGMIYVSHENPLTERSQAIILDGEASQETGQPVPIEYLQIRADRTTIYGLLEVEDRAQVHEQLEIKTDTAQDWAALSGGKLMLTKDGMTSTIETVRNSMDFPELHIGQSLVAPIGSSTVQGGTLQTILNDLTSRIEALETSNSDLISRVEALEAQL